MEEPFAATLAEPEGNSLGRTVEVVQAVLEDETRLAELLELWRDGPPWTRLRAASAVKRIAAERPALVAGRLDVVLGPIAEVEQASARWTVALLVERYADELDPDQRARATAVLQRSLTEDGDWIVLANAASALGALARGDDEGLGEWLRPQLERLSADRRPSVAKRAARVLASL